MSSKFRGGRAILSALVVLAVAATALVLSSSSGQAQDAPTSVTPQATWQVNGEVHALHVVGDVLYIGGEFTALIDGNGNSVARENLAAINRVTGQPHFFSADTDSKVWALESSDDGSTLYVGGNFRTIRGQDRNRLAAFNVSNGSFASFQPTAGPNNVIRALSAEGNRLYVGGIFTSMGGQTRNYLAAFNTDTSALTNWAPSANQDVKAIVADGSKVWVGGFFSRINGKSARALAAVNASNGELIATDHPGVDVIDLALLNNRLYVAGGGPGGTAYAFNASTGRQLWSTGSDGNFQGVDAAGDFAYFGGHHERMDGIAVRQMTRVNINTGQLDRSWLPGVNGIRGVNAVVTAGNEVYIGGDFTRIGGQNHQGVAGFGSDVIVSGAPSEPPPSGGSAPELELMRMIDEDNNGYVDTVKVFFDQNLAACNAACTNGWDLDNVPSNGRLRSVSVDGNVAQLNLNEGNEGPDTAVRRFTVALGSGNNIRSADGSQASFPHTAPRDAAHPIPYHFRKMNGDVGGQAGAGDSFQVLWSEPIDTNSVPSRVRVVVSDLANNSNDRFEIEGVTAGQMNLGSKDYLVCTTGPCSVQREVTFANSAVAWSSGDSILTVTFGNCSGSCGLLSRGAEVEMTFVPADTILDLDGESARGSVDKTLRMF